MKTVEVEQRPISTGPEADFELIGDGPWDGKTLAYIPREYLTLPTDLNLDSDFDAEVDPVTYQVIRWKLWSANLEHSDTIKRVSGSAIIVYMDDFNTSILTEDGDNLVCGPSIQYFTGLSDLVIKWTLENRSQNPGIAEGDVFIQCDPYIGAPHQMDVALYAPVFWEAKLFCWIYSAGHFGDLGGTVPGSFCPEADDIFSEPTPVPPMKLSRGGVLQDDVAEMFTRTSRTPEMVALQIRSQLAGLHTTEVRLRELIETYSPTAVKGTMRRMINDCSTAVERRLADIPDGTWRERLNLSGITPEDAELHPIALTVRKEDGVLTCANAGTAPQTNAINCTYGAWRSALICAASTLFAYDQLYCPAGVLSHMRFEPTPGTMNCATHPAAVTTLQALIVTVNVSMQTLSKMAISGGPSVRGTANASGGQSMGTWYVLSGTDRRGKFVAEVAGDSLHGAIGAFAERDGMDTSGSWWWPNSLAGESEEWEQAMPFLYLYRREMRDSGGAGRWRGGNGAQVAVIGHKTPDARVQLTGADPAVNVTPGHSGGLPGHSGNDQYLGSSGIRGRLAAGSMPRDEDDLNREVGTLERVPSMANLPLLPDDILVFDYSAGAGIGDPLLRPYDDVAGDVRDGRLSVAKAKRHYGVVVDPAGGLDAIASDVAREAIKEERRASSTARGPLRSEKVDASGAHPIGIGLGVIDPGGGPVWVCLECSEVLADLDSNPKGGMLSRELRMNEVDPENYPAPSDFSDADVVMRQHLCPGCVQLMAVEVCAAGEEPIWETELRTLPEGASVQGHDVETPQEVHG